MARGFPGIFPLLLLASCASSYLRSADLEGTAIQLEKTSAVDRFREERLIDPREESADRSPRPAPEEIPALLSLRDAARLAEKYSRALQGQRESLFLTCLDLGLVRRDFGAFVFSGSVSNTATNSRHDPWTDVSALALSGTRVLPWGGSVTVSSDATFGTSVSALGGTDQSATVSGSVTATQPLLQGAGREVAFETLTQAERDAAYAAREFDLFRQGFAIDLVEQYYNLVSQKRSLANLKKSADAQEMAYKQASALYRVGRGTKVDELRAEQSLLTAQSNLLASEQAYRLGLDRFKILLGLPTDVTFDVPAEAIPQIVPLEVDLEKGVAAALNNRLELMTSRDRVVDAERGVRISRNALLPALDLTATYSIDNDPRNSFRDLSFQDDDLILGITLELPLDRKAQRNAYRASMISLDQARRDLQRAEDEVILGIRDSLRQLNQQRSQIAIEDRNIESLRRSVRKAEIDFLNGNASNRDVVEAIAALTDALNSQNDRYVAYEIARLSLLRQLGLLFVDREGSILP